MDFNEAVRVIWPGEVSGVVARAVNLSLAGMRIDAPTPTPCAVGSDVLCDVTLPRGQRLLRGRVAHRRLLSSAKVGMGIEFVDLSARELAELRDIVGDAPDGLGPHPQRVKVRFEGTNQVVRARAFPTERGFRLATSLPFLKMETEVDIALPTEAGASVRGWVSAVALERSGAGESPRLFIDVDVRVDDRDQWLERPAFSDALESDDVTPVEAVPAHVWDEEELAATTQDSVAVPSVPTIVASSPALPPIVGGPGSAPHLRGDDSDLTEVVALPPPPRSSRWRALGGGMLAGAVALGAFVTAVVFMRSPAPSPVAAAPHFVSPQVSAPAQAPASPAVTVAPAAEPAPAHEARAAAPEPREAADEATHEGPAAEPPAAEAATPAETFSVGLSGSLAGSQRYPLRNPDGVAFNLPHAQATMKLGTYRPAVRGLKAVWVRALPGGGVHLRFFFASARSAPRIDLGRDAVVVTSR